VIREAPALPFRVSYQVDRTAAGDAAGPTVVDRTGPAPNGSGGAVAAVALSAQDDTGKVEVKDQVNSDVELSGGLLPGSPGLAAAVRPVDALSRAR
jgi:hypothetical protein